MFSARKRARQVPRGRRDRVLTLSAERSEVGTVAARSNRLIGVILTVLLAVSMIPAAGIQSAFADEPVERPATTGGDAALEGYSAEAAPVATQREDGMYVAGGLVYTVTDGGLSLVGFDGLPQGEDALKEIVVPEAVSVDGKDTAVVSVAIAEGNVAESVVSLTLPQSITDIDTATLAPAFPNLASVEVAAPKASSVPVAAGAAAMKAAYSSFGGILYKNIRAASESDASQTTLTKELVWAPPATVVARIPAECTSIVSGAFAGVKDLKTVACFGVMGEIPQTQKADDGTVTPGAFTDEQIQTVDVIVPQTGTVVPNGDRVSADVAVTDHSTMDIKRDAWWKSGFASDRITLGEVYGSTTNTLPVTEEGTLEVAEAEVAYAPETTQNSSSRKAGIEPPESAIPTPVPDDDSIDSSESGLVFTHLADMTLSVSWKGDPTTTPKHLDIPAYVTIGGVAYPVTEVAEGAFEGAVFLESVDIPEGVTTIGASAFAGCANLVDVTFPLTPRTVAESKSSDVASSDTTDPADPAASELNASTDSEGKETPPGDGVVTPLTDDSISSYSSFPINASTVTLYVLGGSNTISVNVSGSPSDCSVSHYTPFNEVTYTKSGALDHWDVRLNSSGQIALFGVNSSNSALCNVYFNKPTGWTPVGVSGNSSLAAVTVSCVRDEAVGSVALATTSHTHAASSITSGTLDAARIPSLDASKVGSGTFGSARIADGAIATAKLAANAVTSAKIADGTVVAADLAGSAVTNAKIAANAVDSSKIADGAVVAADLAANAVETGKIKDGAVTSAKIADGTIAAADLANGSVTTDKLGANAVTSAKIADGTIGTADLANGSVTDDKLAVKFGTITYSGLDGADSSVYPTVYRQGGTPALPTPKKAGARFLGWTWSGQSDPTTDAATVKGAFAGSGAVALTANWGDPEARYFFSEDAPCKDGGGTHAILVKLTNDKGSFTKARLTFAKKDDAPVANASGVMFSTTDGSGTAVLGSADAVTANLVEVDGGWGVRVTVEVKQGALTPAVASYTDASYVASLAKMSYTFA